VNPRTSAPDRLPGNERWFAITRRPREGSRRTGHTRRPDIHARWVPQRSASRRPGSRHAHASFSSFALGFGRPRAARSASHRLTAVLRGATAPARDPFGGSRRRTERSSGVDRGSPLDRAPGVVARGRASPRGTSKGNQAQEGEGAHHLQRWGRYSTRSRSNASKVRRRGRDGEAGGPETGPRAAEAGASCNTRGAAGRGDAVRLRPRELLRGVGTSARSSRGSRRGEREHRDASGAFGLRCEPADRETRRTPGSAAGCNKPATSGRSGSTIGLRPGTRRVRGGGTRRGGEKPRGRNGIDEGGALVAEVGAAWRHVTRLEWTPRGRSMEGRSVAMRRIRRIPREAIGDDPDRPGALDGSQDHEGRPRCSSSSRRDRHGTPRGPTGDGEGRGGSGEAQRPATCRARR